MLIVFKISGHRLFKVVGGGGDHDKRVNRIYVNTRIKNVLKPGYTLNIFSFETLANIIYKYK